MQGDDGRAQTVMEQLRQLHAAGRTGSYSLTTPGIVPIDIYFMNGDLVGCSTALDDDSLSSLLIRNGGVNPAVLRDCRSRADEDEPLAELLAEQASVDDDALAEVRRDIFLDNLYRAVTLHTNDGRFQSEEAVFPPNMQLDHDTGDLLDEAEQYLETSESARRRLGTGRPLGWLHGVAPDHLLGDDGAVAEFVDNQRGVDEMLRDVPMAPFRVLRVLGAWLNRGFLGDPAPPPPPPSPPQPEGEPEGIFEDLTDLRQATAGETVLSMPSFSALKQAGLLDKMDDSAARILDLPPPAGLDTTELRSPIQMHQAGRPMDRGPSIEILDPTEDSGSLDPDPPAPTHFPPAPDFPPAPAEQLAEGVPDLSSMFGATDGGFGQAPTSDAAGKMSPLPPPDTLGALQAPQVTSAVQQQLDSPSDSYDSVDSIDLPPGVDQAADHARDLARHNKPLVRLFNDMLLVMHDEFAAAIGVDATQNRFRERMLQAADKFPRVLSGLQPSDVGQVSNKRLARNLITSGVRDADDQLRGALYELVYQQLYDIKTTLTPAKEQSLMERLEKLDQRVHDYMAQ